MIGRLAQVATPLAERVAAGLGLTVPAPGTNPPPAGSHDGTQGGPAGARPPAPQTRESTPAPRPVDRSPALSMVNTIHDTIKSRRIAILAADGVQGGQIATVKAALEAAGAHVKIVAPTLGTIQSTEGTAIIPDMSVRTAPSVTFDGVFIPGGAPSAQTLGGLDDVLQFVHDAYKHCKVLAVAGEGATLLAAARIPVPAAPGATNATSADPGLLVYQAGANLDQGAQQFIAALAQHRHWAREQALTPPA